MPDPRSLAPSADRSPVGRRRLVFLSLVLITIAALLALMVRALGTDRLDIIDWLMLITFGITLPWTAIGFWNALIGLGLMLVSRDPAASATPVARLGLADEPIITRTAILVCIRNEDPKRLERNLSELLAGLDAGAFAQHFEVFLLSDSDQPTIMAGEAGLAQRMARRGPESIPVTYRRREHNTAFKAGNIRDFCERWGAGFDHAVVLDADSYMSTEAILRLVRVMQADPSLGIVQTLVVGLPSSSPFARVFQFGMRLGMRSYTLGSAWWQGDCGPYWGHNAILRLAPFTAHCELPQLPGKGPLSGPILSHDQVEAVLMRRAGLQVRVLPLEDGSWEENPPTLLEFIRRDLRWCQGNMQYWRLLALPGLKTVSRIQLLLAILMFIGSPAWLLMVLLTTFRGILLPIDGPVFEPQSAGWLLTIVLTMVFAPKIATVIAVLADGHARRAFGGGPRFLGAVAIETVFSAMLAPIMAVAHSVFLGGLAMGRAIGWTAQLRDDHAVPLDAAMRRLWLHTLLGALLLWWFHRMNPSFALLFAPFYGPLLLAVPFAMLTALPGLGAAMARAAIAAIPEEVRVPPALARLSLPALAHGHASR